MKERYFSTVEYVDRYGKANRQYPVYGKAGTKLTIGDFIQAFRESGLEVEIVDFGTMTFKPTNAAQSSLISLRVIRTLKDYTYKPSAG